METEPCDAYGCTERKVVSLPMRDGNDMLQNVPGAHHVVVSLPMRDGNVWYVTLTASRRFVVSLPMRDGNGR